MRFHAECQAAAVLICQVPGQRQAQPSAWTFPACDTPLSLLKDQFALLFRDGRACIPDTESVLQQRQADGTAGWAVAKSVFEQVGNDFHGAEIATSLLDPFGPLGRPSPGACLQTCRGLRSLDQRL